MLTTSGGWKKTEACFKLKSILGKGISFKIFFWKSTLVNWDLVNKNYFMPLPSTCMLWTNIIAPVSHSSGFEFPQAWILKKNSGFLFAFAIKLHLHLWWACFHYFISSFRGSNICPTYEIHNIHHFILDILSLFVIPFLCYGIIGMYYLRLSTTSFHIIII